MTHFSNPNMPALMRTTAPWWSHKRWCSEYAGVMCCDGHLTRDGASAHELELLDTEQWSLS